ncbi:hypothetical protein KC573_04100 [candidate division WWE3 bacterium]|uniref:Double-GTPase 2 domain-containing protein n=1 Tax=candidate division WWE3 bacterium TaxID=2053526 RepID=A0A955RWL7_UNCKA|nr:hypothetical protein [candidate division WWE3 bacterium]
MIFRPKRIICPNCHSEIRILNTSRVCATCEFELPMQYVKHFEKHTPLFIQVFGWSQVGKTVYQDALVLLLTKMANIWPKFAYTSTTEMTQRKLERVNEFYHDGKLPEATQLDRREPYVMLLHNMVRWGGRTLILRDCAGESFDKIEVSEADAPFLLKAPIIFMFISIPDIQEQNRQSMDMLLNNYINTLVSKDVDIQRSKKKIVIIFTKGDLLHDLPPHLHRYLNNDPIWNAVNREGPTKAFDSDYVEKYVNRMTQINHEIAKWICRDYAGKSFMNLAQQNNLDLRFSLVSATGSQVGKNGYLKERLRPRRVLDPFFWALELQKELINDDQSFSWSRLFQFS